MNNTEQQLFTIQRFQLLSHYVQANDDVNSFTPSYAYAWSELVYPIFGESASWHVPFKACFKTTEEATEELYDFLCDLFDENKTITFYELERHYGISGSTSSGEVWNRHRLVSACRYFYLHDTLSSEFWSALLKNGDCPSEAHSISRKFTKKDIYFQ